MTKNFPWKIYKTFIANKIHQKLRFMNFLHCSFCSLSTTIPRCQLTFSALFSKHFLFSFFSLITLIPTCQLPFVSLILILCTFLFCFAVFPSPWSQAANSHFYHFFLKQYYLISFLIVKVNNVYFFKICKRNYSP